VPPLKVYFQVGLVILLGLGGTAWLGARLFGALRRKNKFASLGFAFILTLWFGVALTLCSALIPCFNLWVPSFCQGNPQKKWIALTFDDGPNEPYTSQILDILDKKQVPATFFTLGQNVSRFPEVIQRMNREGFTVGNHTYDHRPLWKFSREQILGEIEGWENAMTPLGIPPVKLFRAPHGWKSPYLKSILASKGYRLIGWTRGVWDTDLPGEALLFERITHAPTNGTILLLHDGVSGRPQADRSDLVAVLPKIIDYYRDQGFRFVSLSEMLQDR